MNHAQKPLIDAGQRLAHHDQITVVRHEAGRGAEVNDGACRGRDLAVAVNVRHHVVTQSALVLGDVGEIDVVAVLSQLIDLRAGDVQPKLVLGFRERDPEVSPGARLAQR